MGSFDRIGVVCFTGRDPCISPSKYKGNDGTASCYSGVLDDNSLFLFLVSKFDGIAFVATFLSY
jgi:hypothetical protein